MIKKEDKNPNWKGGKTKVFCIVCRKELLLFPSLAKNRKFCSRKCKAKWQEINLIHSKNPHYRGGKLLKNCILCLKQFRVFPAFKKQRFCSNDCRLKWWNLECGEMAKGSKNLNWKGGITLENERIRKSLEYKRWRIAVFIKDNRTCQRCLSKKGKIEADHIRPFSLYPELRFEVSNGRTLCHKCHKKTPSYGYKSSFQLELF